ncbi:MAG: DNA-binding response regulator [Roseateles depolymerans]|uniref:Phosphate regulon transcriptional regulatory protein PhoB n=1 Tax=Roseateles depolymerans TaxID=76731 RepID=A0A2W5DH90_9BURK|nr:MAG: DNA-binding response regulator [Roseateles depolymerans]
MPPKLLLVEDDDAIAELLQLEFGRAGYDALREADGRHAMQAIDTEHFDLVLLDLMLPGADGFDVCRHMQARHRETPVIIVSARTAEAHRVLGLELGADDYLVKPFSMLELLARVRALLRRVELLRQPQLPTQWRIGPHHRLDTLSRELLVKDRSVPLTLREFDLLFFLARHPGQVFSRGDLLDRVWGQGFDGYEHTVNSHINRLRQKVETNPQQPRLIETVWGVGYRFSAPTGMPS